MTKWWWWWRQLPACTEGVEQTMSWSPDSPHDLDDLDDDDALDDTDDDDDSNGDEPGQLAEGSELLALPLKPEIFWHKLLCHPITRYLPPSHNPISNSRFNIQIRNPISIPFTLSNILLTIQYPSPWKPSAIWSIWHQIKAKHHSTYSLIHRSHGLLVVIVSVLLMFVFIQKCFQCLCYAEKSFKCLYRAKEKDF